MSGTPTQGPSHSTMPLSLGLSNSILAATPLSHKVKTRQARIRQPAISTFSSRSGVKLIIGFIALLLVVAGLSTFLIWRKRWAREYKKMKELHDEDEAPFFYLKTYRDSWQSETLYGHSDLPDNITDDVSDLDKEYTHGYRIGTSIFLDAIRSVSLLRVC